MTYLTLDRESFTYMPPHAQQNDAPVMRVNDVFQTSKQLYVLVRSITGNFTLR